MNLRVCVGLVLAACFGMAAAQTVSMSGRLGDKALLIIDGAPRTVAAGATVQGVHLVSVTSDAAVVEVGGRRVTLALGGAQVDLGGAASAGGGTQIVLSEGTGGHYWTSGSINGKSVSFVVDTGATNVSLSLAEAERLGLDLKQAQRGIANTANGQVTAYRVMLDVVRVGDVQVYNVAATVVPTPMPQVLLGNSFLSHFQMKRDSDTMVLTKRY
ncbi:MAG: retroviral-like aspartic protease family protein [Proteobacteria bacterium]|nr:retroviral-like aspartic protease family protein [Pseudomonadota bacterium]